MTYSGNIFLPILLAEQGLLLRGCLPRFESVSSAGGEADTISGQELMGFLDSAFSLSQFVAFSDDQLFVGDDLGKTLLMTLLASLMAPSLILDIRLDTFV